jgi:hypothetical protein
MIIRELLIRLGFDYDDRPYKKADRAIDQIKGKMAAMSTAANTAFAGMGRLFAGIAGIYGARQLIEMSSSANETLNVLNEAFQQNSREVQEWARAFGRDVGRSEYEMRELAGTIGAVLTPMMDSNAAVSADMSKKLAQLAVDLGSFYNVADSDALAALRAALIGQAEPMYRYGVILQDATIQEYLHEKGIRKKFNTMSIAEKTALRYNFILDKTRQAQGDAKRTSDGYANAIKGVQGALKDLAIGFMSSVMPSLEKFTVKIRDDVLPVLKDIFDKTNILKAALIVLGARMLVAWAPALIPMLAVAAALAAIVLVVDEAITLFEGGKTVIGDAIDTMFGKGATQKIVDSVNDGWKILIEEVGRADEKIKGFVEDLTDAWANFHVFSKEWRDGFAIIKDTKIDKDFLLSYIKFELDEINRMLDALKAKWENFKSWLSGGIGVIEKAVGAKEGLEKRLKKVGEIAVTGVSAVAAPMVKPAYDVYQQFGKAGTQLDMYKVAHDRPRAAERGVNARLLKGPSFGQANAEKPNELQHGKAAQQMRGPVTSSTQNNNVSQQINVTNNISAPTQAPEKLAAEIGKSVVKAVNNNPKNVLAALKQGI